MERIQRIFSQTNSMEASALKCVLCENFLSVPPILYNDALGSVCGRENCAKIAKSKGTNYQQSAYEVLAKCLKFPCMYENDGCEEQLYWDEVSNHEYHCKFGIALCPFTSDQFENTEDGVCIWEGETSTLLNHMEEAHPTHKFENYVRLDFKEATENNKLFFARIQDSIVILFSIIDQKPNFHLEVWSGTEIHGNLKYKIEFSDESEDHTASSILRRAECIRPKFFKSKMNNKRPEIHPDILSSLFKSASLTVKFYFDGLLINPIKKLDGDDLIVENNDCVNCANKLKHPIYLCERSQHKVCYKCRTECNNIRGKGEVCPRCKSKIFKIPQPCEPIECLICKGKTSCVSSHIYNVHKESIRELNKFYSINIDEKFSYIFCFDDNIFILNLDFEKEGFRFSIKCLGSKDIKYKYNIELLTLRSSTSSLAFTDFCYPEKMCSGHSNKLCKSLSIPGNWLECNTSSVPFKLKISRI